MNILRYERTLNVTTALNPLEDLTGWISGLRSEGYAADILRSIHGKAGKTVRTEARLMGVLAANAVGLIEQAYTGIPELSYLPLYYAILNLSKICIIASKGIRLLEANRFHGAGYNPVKKTSQSLLTEQVQLHKSGVIQLLYEALTTTPWGNFGRALSLGDVYPFIGRVSLEFRMSFGRLHGMQEIDIQVEGLGHGEFRLRAQLMSPILKHADSRRYLKLLEGSWRLDPDDATILYSRSVAAPNASAASQALLPSIRRYLIYHSRKSGQIRSTTPISSKNLLLPEEIPIWIAFFHLSNIVRYKPEYLKRLSTSKEWPLLLALRRHAMLQYLLLFWSYLNQKNYNIVLA